MQDTTRRRPVDGILNSLRGSIGDIAFGMEDGAVSIAGLVFGVAASTNDAQIVLLAGASGAAAGAVAMMAGTYLDVQSTRDRAIALREGAARSIAEDPEGHRRRVEERLRAEGFTEAEAATTGAALARNPEAMLELVAAIELGIGSAPRESPGVHAAWMFVADIIAAATPVIPFLFLPFEVARVVSIVMTTILLVGLGIGRARVGQTRVLRTVLQTLAIAASAAIAGVAIGRLVTG
ncbi:MAG: VIT1/CCC1 transporter family protein [Chloroflexi bacterium]|jgi:VIT1/CCC1 family predicted Fe2+/Mn2+ transporter|nr:VIT1/CCC1 transporter family protein [Chloroflexota bacterium]